jgi:hypothetical protein
MENIELSKGYGKLNPPELEEFAKKVRHSLSPVLEEEKMKKWEANTLPVKGFAPQEPMEEKKPVNDCVKWDKTLKCWCRKCEPQEPMEWDYGSLTFDEIKNILDVCNVNNVKIEQDYLTISFAPKNATGNTWLLLKEKMHQIIKK